MFTVFIDDSGTDPRQRVAIGAAIIVPAVRLEEFDLAWKALLQEELISEFHTSECVAGQSGTEYYKWNWQRKKHICYQVREITKRFAVKAFSFAINKADYDEVIPPDDELRVLGGKYHYTWAIRHVVTLLDMWSGTVTKKPFEYVFDCMGSDRSNEAKREVEAVMAQADSYAPGRYLGRYSFKSRKDHPGLQCVDLLAWCSYQFALNRFTNSSLNSIAEDTFSDFDRHLSDTWFFAITISRADLGDWAVRERADPRSQERRRLARQAQMSR